jgi:hypothetical protein
MPQLGVRAPMAVLVATLPGPRHQAGDRLGDDAIVSAALPPPLQRRGRGRASVATLLLYAYCSSPTASRGTAGSAAKEASASAGRGACSWAGAQARNG